MKAKKRKQAKPTDTRMISFSSITNNAELDSTIAGLSLMEGCERVGIRSLGDRTNSYDRWRVDAFFPYNEALAQQDGATVWA